MTDILTLSGVAMARLIREGKVSSAELIQMHRARIAEEAAKGLEGDWQDDLVNGSDDAIVETAIAALKPLGCRIVLFVDPDPDVIARLGNTGADGIEIYTGTYAAAFRAGDGAAELHACAETALRAGRAGLTVNAGHDLNLRNLPGLVTALPNLAEASIGHELTADALEIGFANAVRAYKAALAGAG